MCVCVITGSVTSYSSLTAVFGNLLDIIDSASLRMGTSIPEKKKTFFFSHQEAIKYQQQRKYRDAC